MEPAADGIPSFNAGVIDWFSVVIGLNKDTKNVRNDRCRRDFRPTLPGGRGNVGEALVTGTVIAVAVRTRLGTVEGAVSSAAWGRDFDGVSPKGGPLR